MTKIETDILDRITRERDQARRDKELAKQALIRLAEHLDERSRNAIGLEIRAIAEEIL